MAVAIKKIGFANIVIYNGGLKDWQKAGLSVQARDPLPLLDVSFVSGAELQQDIAEAEASGCLDQRGNPLLTIIDIRSPRKFAEHKGGDQYRLKTSCRTITAKIDDFLENEAMLNSVPRAGLVVTITETGNRDSFLIRYLYKFGNVNTKGLQFGMRGWLKADYPVERIATPPRQ